MEYQIRSKGNHEGSGETSVELATNAKYRMYQLNSNHCYRKKPTTSFGHKRELRVVLYSHDTMGLGHMRRNMLIARILAAPPVHANVLLIGGAHELSRFNMTQGIDCLTLPSLYKDAAGNYGSKHFYLTMDKLREVRGKSILAAIRSFEPHVMIVDKVPTGAIGELGETLEYIGGNDNIRAVLGLRDVIDAPATVRREWKQYQSLQIIKSYYDSVWVYGDQSVYDIVREYELPAEVAHKVCYTGYLDRSGYLDNMVSLESLALHDMVLPDEKIVLCLVGGGQDGFEVAWTFANAELPPGYTGLILTGPFMPAEYQNKLQDMAVHHSRLKVLDFITEPVEFIQKADRVITMGGYNSICEVISSGKHALVIPRVTPRTEQIIRAEQMQSLGLLNYLSPQALTPEAISTWLRSEPERADKKLPVDFKGAQRIPFLLSKLIKQKRYLSLTKEQREGVTFYDAK